MHAMKERRRPYYSSITDSVGMSLAILGEAYASTLERAKRNKPVARYIIRQRLGNNIISDLLTLALAD